MFIDKNKIYLGEIKNSIRNEIAVYQRMGNVLHIYQRAIIMKCDREEFVPVVMDDCSLIVQSIAPVWTVKKMTDYRRKDFPRAITNVLNKNSILGMAVKTGLLKAPWYVSCMLFRNKFYSRPDTLELFEQVLKNERGSSRYNKFISELSYKMLNDMPMVLLVDAESLRSSIVDDIRKYIMSNSNIRIGALLWVFVTNTNSGSIKEIMDEEKIPVTVI